MLHRLRTPRALLASFVGARGAPTDQDRGRSSERGRPRRRAGRLGAVTGVLALIGLTAAVAATIADQHAGPQGDGTAIIPVGYRVTPAGTQTNLGDLPLALSLSPDGKTLLVSNDGQGLQSLQVVDAGTSHVLQTIPYASPKSLFMGLAFSPDGQTAYASGGGDEKIHVYSVAGGALTEQAPLSLPTTDPSGKKINMYPAGLAVTADGRRLVVADHLADAASVVDTTTGAVSTVAVGHNPVGAAVMPDGATAFVTNQGANTVSVLDISGAAPTVRSTVTVGTHPNALALDPVAGRLYVANGDSDEVTVINTATSAVDSTIDLAPAPHAAVGTNPTGLSLSPDRSLLYVANSGNNDVDVIALGRRGQSDASHEGSDEDHNGDDGGDHGGPRVLGSIPTAWYPSAVVATGSKLFVASAKGLGAGPNDGPGYPNPTSHSPTSPDQYVGSMMVGTLSTVSLPVPQGTLARYTTQVTKNNRSATEGDEDGGAWTHRIQHVIYIVKENRTYDQVFGSLGRGAGDPALNLFGEESAPNSRALERQFVTLDNFYADAEVSAQGWNWAVASNSNPFSEALWPANYSGRNAPYPSESADPAIAPNRTQADSYVWDRLASAGITFRNYGFYVSADASNQMVAGDPVLNANTDHAYHGYDLNCPDSPDTFTAQSTRCGLPRVSEWLREFNQYVLDGNLPTVEFVRLPNDHTSGTSVGKPTPQAYVADNDLALGKLVDAVSHSPYWSSTVIFATEDDAQNGPDHIDAHRTTAWLVSPYTHTGKVDSTFYSTVSMLRTIEDIVGIRPLTQFDSFATPMSAAFTNKADTTPYTVVRPADAGNILNAANAPMAAESAQQRLDKEDEIDMETFNQAIWQSVHGAGSTMPAPRHGRIGAPPASGADGDD
jgi:YVTN family beta-propeller protein